MPHPFLSNPYPLPLREHKVSTRVSHLDAAYLKSLFPFIRVHDIILSTVYAAVVSSLRSSGLDISSPESVAWSVDHPSYDLLNSILQRLSAGLTLGDSSTPDVGRGTQSLHLPHGDTESIGSNSQSNPSCGGGEDQEDFDENPQAFHGGPGPRPSQESVAQAMLEKLRNTGIL